MSSVYTFGGNLYSGSPIWSAINNMSGGGAQRQDTIDLMVKRGYLQPLAAQPTQQNSTAGNNRQPFQPNQFTQSQLAGMGAAPQWMMDAYTNKIGQMGGNANLPPFAVTQSGFPGQAGKPGLPSAPTGTVGGTNG
jgi:hypothetical protein